MGPRPGSLEWLELRIEEEQTKQDELREKHEELKEWVTTALEQRVEVESVLQLRQQPPLETDDDEASQVNSPGQKAADPGGVIPTSDTSSPGYANVSASQGSAATSSPDVWDDIVGPVGFLQQFENKLFGVDENRNSSASNQLGGLSESSTGTAVANGVGVHAGADGDEGEAGEVTVFQAVLRHVEEQRTRQYALQENLRLELGSTRKEHDEQNDKLENEVTGLIPEIKEKGRQLENKQKERDQLEIEKAQLEDEVRQAVEEYEAHHLRVIDHAATATRGAGVANTESWTQPAAGEPPVALLPPADVLERAEHDCALARERADALREAMSQLAKVAEVARRQQSRPDQ